MAKQFKLQDPGEGVHEAEILDVLIAEGDSVEEGDELFSVETDKAAVGIPAPFTGTIEEIRVKAGDVANVGDVLLTYSEAGAEGTQDEEKKEADAGETENAEDQENPEEEPRAEDAKGGEEKAEAKEESGEEKKADKAETSEEGEKEKRPEEREVRERAKAGDGEREPGHAPAAPATRRLARKLGVDLDDIDGSGPDGRVEEDDVRRAAGRGESDTRHEPAGGLPDFSRWGPVEEMPFRGIRRRIAQRMAQSWRTIPHVTHTDVFDVTELDEYRREHAGDFEDEGGKLTVTVFAVKAVAAALKEFPRFNASLDAESDSLILKQYCHVGVAVATEQGLLVPVVRDADRKSLADLSREVVQLAERARDAKLEPDDMRGGSITITNPGAIGASVFTPIINYPEVAIVGLGTARTEPVAVIRDGDPGLEYRVRMPLSLAFDHRVNDGADAARFAARIGELLGSPHELLLEA